MGVHRAAADGGAARGAHDDQVAAKPFVGPFADCFDIANLVASDECFGSGRSSYSPHVECHSMKSSVQMVSTAKKETCLYRHRRLSSCAMPYIKEASPPIIDHWWTRTTAGRGGSPS
mmetsp:Transcript_41883/g.112170  ORF Transcript_41883/g.112170 Transcript_41883/m.112170 type:complete len:117 (+) Transcript_41883:460-810(+)